MVIAYYITHQGPRTWGTPLFAIQNLQAELILEPELTAGLQNVALRAATQGNPYPMSSSGGNRTSASSTIICINAAPLTHDNMTSYTRATTPFCQIALPIFIDDHSSSINVNYIFPAREDADGSHQQAMTECKSSKMDFDSSAWLTLPRRG
jgi:hypothetical protein